MASRRAISLHGRLVAKNNGARQTPGPSHLSQVETALLQSLLRQLDGIQWVRLGRKINAGTSG